MKITFYGYNAFIIESKDKKIAIDPGALFFTGSGLPRLFQNQNGPISLISLLHMVTLIIIGIQTEWQRPQMLMLCVIKPC